MGDREGVLGAAAARVYYDRFGKKQDSQGFYEDAALNDLVDHASFESSRCVFEFGCGTGNLAARLLENHLPPSASYFGYDVSPVMIGLAKRRLESYGERAQVVLSDGAIQFPVADHSVDRVVTSYVLDLLSKTDIENFFAESLRVLMPGGRACIASLTRGVSIPSRIVSALWSSVFRVSPALLGGCRPIQVDAFVNPREWRIVHRRIVTPFGVPSEVLILTKEGVLD